MDIIDLRGPRGSSTIPNMNTFEPGARVSLRTIAGEMLGTVEELH